MFNNMKNTIFIFFYVFSVNAFAGPIGLEGDEIDAAMIRTIDDPFYGSGRVCCYGLDGPFVVEEGLGDQKKYSSSFLLDVNSLSFDLDYIGFGSWQKGLVLRLSDLDFGNGNQSLVGINIDTNVSNLTWLVGSNFVDLFIGDTRQDKGLFINGSFVVASVPEPSGLLLLAFGLALLILKRSKVFA